MQNKKWYGLLALIMLLAGCVSDYETVYHYSPPVSERGEQCVAQCDQTNNACLRVCGADCQVDAQGQEQCQPTASCQCEQEYRACYQLCGGQVSVAGRQKVT